MISVPAQFIFATESDFQIEQLWELCSDDAHKQNPPAMGYSPHGRRAAIGAQSGRLTQQPGRRRNRINETNHRPASGR
jgi:hypothetical protein